MAKGKSDNYLIKSLNGMAYGFFCSLVIGTILKQMGSIFNVEQLVSWGNIATYMTGGAIGVGVAYAVGAKGLNLVGAIIAGTIGAGTFNGGGAAIGDPVGAYIASVLAIEATRFVQGKTPVDILIVPLCSIMIAGLATLFLAPYLTKMILWIGNLVNQGVKMQPILMSIVVAVLMGLIITGPISSAAIGVMLNLSGLAAGAALAGCCAQMIGFAVMSIEDNDIGDVLAIGIGTSMLQFNNIIKRPILWLPPILTTIITAPIATVILNIECTPVGSGMGMAGFVGPLSAIEVMGVNYWIPIVLVNIVLPAIITYAIYKAFRKLNYIRKGDLKIQRL